MARRGFGYRYVQRARRIVKRRVATRSYWSRLGPRSRALVRRAGGPAVMRRLGPKGKRYALRQAAKRRRPIRGR